jgi:hypothetical protein
MNHQTRESVCMVKGTRKRSEKTLLDLPPGQDESTSIKVSSYGVRSRLGMWQTALRVQVCAQISAESVCWRVHIFLAVRRSKSGTKRAGHTRKSVE